MNKDEWRAIWWSVGVLFLASVFRFGWEARPVPPLLPPDTTAYADLVPATEAAVADQARRRTPLAPGERIDPNRVDAVELARLPGVGPALAARIEAFRETRGWIHGSEELAEVSGIGPATLDRLRPLLVFTPPPADWRPPASAGSGGGAVSGGDGRVDLNVATEIELETLPGVGPALASRIVEDRRRNGPFRSVEDLPRVSGIGPALMERLRPLIRVS